MISETYVQKTLKNQNRDGNENNIFSHTDRQCFLKVTKKNGKRSGLKKKSNKGFKMLNIKNDVINAHWCSFAETQQNTSRTKFSISILQR